MSAIKRFFEKKKLEYKFKKLGPGQVLASDSRAAGPSRPVRRSPPGNVRREKTESSARAGEAALMRTEQSKSKSFRDPLASAKADIRRQLELDKQRQQERQRLSGPTAQETLKEGVPMLSVTGVFYKCPMVGPMVLPHKEMQSAIESYLYKELEEEAVLSAALIIHTVNKDQDLVKVCIETLCKYLQNIIDFPDEPKYRRIRMGNKAFVERILSQAGAVEFLKAAGFEERMLSSPGSEDPTREEKFLVISPDVDVDKISEYIETLLTAEPIRPELDRGLRIMRASGRIDRFSLPDSFYSINPEELKKEKQLREEAVEKMGMLRTKAMRDREAQRELRRYRYTLIRIRFPDDLLLQATFRAQEKLSALFECVRECIVYDWVPFTLSDPAKKPLSEDSDLTLTAAGLAPAAVVSFAWDNAVARDIAATQGSFDASVYLTPELKALVQTL